MACRTTQARGSADGLFRRQHRCRRCPGRFHPDPDPIGAIVSRGGRPDLAGPALPLVTAPTLLIVGGNDLPVISLNQDAAGRLRCPHQVMIVPGATHLFEEPGTLEAVIDLARDWFARHL
jgi:putative phosphoribosyl transferase